MKQNILYYAAITDDCATLVVYNTETDSTERIRYNSLEEIEELMQQIGRKLTHAIIYLT